MNRNALISDIDELHAIELESYGNDEATEKETFKKLIGNDPFYQSYKLFVLAQEMLIGFYCIRIDESNNKVDLLDIAVSKCHQSKGYGEELLKDLLSKYFKYEIELKVRVDNFSVLKLYEKLGFKKNHRLERYYEDVDGFIYKFKKTVL